MASQRLDYRPTRADLAALLQLAAPLVLIQVGAMLMGVVDTIMVGRVSAQALGARDELAVARGLQRGLVLSVVLAIPISLLMLTVRPVLAWVGQPAPVIPDAAGYVDRLTLSIWPFYAFVVLRQTLQAHRRRP